MQSISLLRKRHGLPVHADFAHRGTDLIVSGPTAFELSCQCLQYKLIASVLFKKDPRNTSGRIAAGFHLTTIAIEDAHECGSTARRRLNYNELVCTNPG